MVKKYTIELNTGKKLVLVVNEGETLASLTLMPDELPLIVCSDPQGNCLGEDFSRVLLNAIREYSEAVQEKKEPYEDWF